MVPICGDPICVFFHDPPVKPVISISPSGVIVEGDSVTLNCISDSNPPAEISWIKGGTIVGSGRIYNISKISSDDSGEYKCKSINEHGEKYSDNVTLNVMYPPRNVSVLISGSGVIVEGDSVTLNCISDSNPPALNFSWFKGRTIVGSGRIYNISKISSDESGEYKCKSINEHGEKYSDNVTFNVMYPPRNVSVLMSGSGVIVEGDSVTLNCISDSNPPALNFSWFKENETSAVGSGQSFSALQSGRFYCQAHNQHGSQRSDAVTVTVHHRSSWHEVFGITVECGAIFILVIIIIIVIQFIIPPLASPRRVARPEPDSDLSATAGAPSGAKSVLKRTFGSLWRRDNAPLGQGTWTREPWWSDRKSSMLADLLGQVMENRRLRVAWGPEERTLSFGPSSRGARSIGASDAPGDGAACSSPICALTSGDSDGPSETDVRKGGRGRIGRLGLVGAPLAFLKSQTLPCASPRFESTLPLPPVDGSSCAL
ncbi:unnamed protein product [Leuciscus chuanchicus]